MRFFVSLAYIFLLFMGIANAQTPVTQGYEIKITGSGISDNCLYLQGYYGQDVFVFDSAKVKGHKIVLFKNKKKEMPAGIYTLTDRFGNEYLDLMIDKDRRFTLIGGEWNSSFVTNVMVEGSDENAQFIEFQKNSQLNGAGILEFIHHDVIDALFYLFPEEFIALKQLLYFTFLIDKVDQSHLLFVFCILFNGICGTGEYSMNRSA